MNWNDLERHFSPARLGRYRTAQSGDIEKAASDYTHNLLLAEAMMPMLNVLEISLRNSINARLSAFYGRADWWGEWVGNPDFSRLNKQINNAKDGLKGRREQQTPDKVLAELTFGFWSSLFNSRHQHVLWQCLRLAFAHCPKVIRKRQNISAALNQVRKLRNRVFHHEPLLWLTPSLIEQHATGATIINWIDPNLGLWLVNHDRLPGVWSTNVLNSN